MSSYKNKRILKWIIANTGYAVVDLFKNKEQKRFSIHRLVAITFIPNPYNLPQVNHIDENKLNNCVSNLEWVTAKQNMNHGTRLERQKASTNYHSKRRIESAIATCLKRRKAILQFKDGEFVARYESAKEASIKTNINHSHICECANGKRYSHAGGYEWKYERNDDLSDVQS